LNPAFLILCLVALYPVVLLLGLWSEIWQRRYYKEITWRQAVAEVKGRRRTILLKLTGLYLVFIAASIIYIIRTGA
jgi:hypothetical protein